VTQKASKSKKKSKGSKDEKKMKKRSKHERQQQQQQPPDQSTQERDDYLETEGLTTPSYEQHSTDTQKLPVCDHTTDLLTFA